METSLAPPVRKLLQDLCAISVHGSAGEVITIGSGYGAPALDQDRLGAIMSEIESLGYVRLRPRVNGGGDHEARPQWRLFAEFDPVVKGWSPRHDAVVLAKKLLAAPGANDTAMLAADLGWPPRRMNPALGCLEAADAALLSKELADRPFAAAWVSASHGTMRFVADHSS